MKTLGEIVVDEEGTRTSGEVMRLCKKPLPGTFCRDHGRRLVVELRDGDLIKLRPLRCRNGSVLLELAAVYRWGLWLQAQNRNLEKAREKKQKLANRRAWRQLARAEERMIEAARKEA